MQRVYSPFLLSGISSSVCDGHFFEIGHVTIISPFYCIILLLIESVLSTESFVNVSLNVPHNRFEKSKNDFNKICRKFSAEFFLRITSDRFQENGQIEAREFIVCLSMLVCKWQLIDVHSKNCAHVKSNEIESVFSIFFFCPRLFSLFVNIRIHLCYSSEWNKLKSKKW